MAAFTSSGSLAFEFFQQLVHQSLQLRIISLLEQQGN